MLFLFFKSSAVKCSYSCPVDEYFAGSFNVVSVVRLVKWRRCCMLKMGSIVLFS